MLEDLLEGLIFFATGVVGRDLTETFPNDLCVSGDGFLAVEGCPSEDRRLLTGSLLR